MSALPGTYSYYINLKDTPTNLDSQTVREAAVEPVTNDTILQVAAAIGEGVTKVKLTTGMGSFSMEGFTEMLTSCRSCRALDLSFCHIDDAGLKKVATACKNIASENLTTIVLHSINQITEQGIRHFSDCHTITTISLQHNMHLTSLPQNHPCRDKVTIHPWTGYG